MPPSLPQCVADVAQGLPPSQAMEAGIGGRSSVRRSLPRQRLFTLSRPALAQPTPVGLPQLHADLLQLVIDLVVADQVGAGFPVMHRAGSAQPSLQGRDVVLAQQRRGGFRWIWSAPGPIGRVGRAVEDRSAGGHGMPPGF